MTLLIRPAIATEATPTPGPWQASQCDDGLWMVHTDGEIIALSDANTRGEPMHEPNARLMAAAPDMLAALQNVQKLISEAALTGFNCNDGDWAERLFASQQMTSIAIRAANGGHRR